MIKHSFYLIIGFILVSCSHNNKSPQKVFGETINHQRHRDKPYVLMISLDGYRYDYTDLYRPKYLSQLKKQGVSAKSLIPIFPSKTFPNHYSLITGMKAQKHGIVANRFYDPVLDKRYQLGDIKSMQSTKWYGGRPIWVEACHQRMVSASFFWVGSEFEIDHCRPTYYYHYKKSTPKEERIKQIVEWFKLPKEKRPHFVTLYFSDIDTAGHRFGPESVQVDKAIQDVDQTLGKLFSQLEKLPFPLNIIVVSDHGMEKISPKKKLYLGNYSVNQKDFKIIGKGPHALLYFKDKSKIKAVYQQFKKAPHITPYYPHEIPPSYGYSDNKRIGDLVLAMESGYYLTIKKEKKIEGGTHGYDPYLYKNMHGIFYAKGPNFKENIEIESFDNVHLYPAIMKILGLKINTPIDGKLSVLAPVIK